MPRLKRVDTTHLPRNRDRVRSTQTNNSESSASSGCRQCNNRTHREINLRYFTARAATEGRPHSWFYRDALDLGGF